MGVDAGGTVSRAVVATMDGIIVGRGHSGPGNPLASGASDAATSVAAAVREALGTHSPARVAAATLGIAGPATAAQFAPALAALGITASITVVGDVVTALAGGAPAVSGSVLIAGTGAIAAAVIDAEVVRTADGLGWLLGDEGSGRWLGLQAIRVAVRNWSSAFAARVATQTGAASSNALVYWAQTLPMAEIGALAPLVCTLARESDPHATAIVEQAVTHLVHTLDELGPADPIVLAGGLLSGDTPVRDGVLTTLRSRSLTPALSLDPAAGAAWLAALPRTHLSPEALHKSLLTQP